jgi:hypothetical protein
VLTVGYPGGVTKQYSLRPEMKAQAQRWLNNYRQLKAKDVGEDETAAYAFYNLANTLRSAFRFSKAISQSCTRNRGKTSRRRAFEGYWSSRKVDQGQEQGHPQLCSGREAATGRTTLTHAAI